jgi:hypothetical protein
MVDVEKLPLGCIPILVEFRFLNNPFPSFPPTIQQTPNLVREDKRRLVWATGCLGAS